MSNFNLPLDPAVVNYIINQNPGVIGSSNVSGTLYVGTIIFDPAMIQANLAFNQANIALNVAQAAYNFANTIALSGSVDLYARQQAANAVANTIYTQGVDATQNSWISSNQIFSQAAFTQANSAGANTIYLTGALTTANANTVYLQGGLNSANANTVYLQGGLNSANANISILFGIETTQNSWISSNQAYSQAAYNQANITAGGLITANANTTLLFSYVNSANANIAIIQGVNSTQNSWISSNQVYSQAAYAQANAANNLAQSAFNYANTKIKYTAGTTPTPNSNIGDQWYNTSTDVLYEYINDGTSNWWVDVDSPSISSGPTVFLPVVLPARTTTSITTPVLANNDTANVQIVGFKSYIIQKFTTSCAAWVRLYTDGPSRANDASRLQSTDPLAGTGVIIEFITTGANTQLVTPGVFGFNNDTTPNTTIYAAITNQSGVSNTVNVTISLLQSE